MPLEFEKLPVEPDITVWKLIGRITIGAEAKNLEALIQENVQQGVRRVVLDLSQVQYIDSTGVGTLAYSYTELKKAGGELVISGAGGKVLTILKQTRMDAFLSFFPTIEEACQKFQAASTPASG